MEIKYSEEEGKWNEIEGSEEVDEKREDVVDVDDAVEMELR